MIKIKMYKANEGDAFLVSLGENCDFNILIDMGLSTTYTNYIKDDLISLNDNGKSINLLIITHVDNDHINGAISFIKENGKDSEIISVKEVWHNSFKHLQFKNKKDQNLPKEENKALETIKRQNLRNVKSNGIYDTKVEEGTTLASLLYEYNYNWNRAFNDKAICVEETFNDISSDVKIVILSPDKNKLNKLSKKWEDKLATIFYDFKINRDEIFDDAFEMYMQNLHESESIRKDTAHTEDKFDICKLASKEEKECSATNGSSISFIIEYDGKKMLFLGDSHENIIYDNLLELKNIGYELKFELVKISHHGSNKNISNRLLNLFTSDRYLVSTDGLKYSHPNIETIAKIAVNNPNHKKEIIFNYKHSKMEVFENSYLEENYCYKINCRNEIIIK